MCWRASRTLVLERSLINTWFMGEEKSTKALICYPSFSSFINIMVPLFWLGSYEESTKLFVCSFANAVDKVDSVLRFPLFIHLLLLTPLEINNHYLFFTSGKW